MALSPVQIVPSLLLEPDVSATTIIGVGSALTTISLVAVAVHPSAFVTVTVYVVFAIGETTIAAVVCAGEVLQLYDVPPLAVSVALAPVHIVPSSLVVPEVSATEMDAVGSALTMIVVEAVSVQPSELVTVTVYVSSAMGETVMAAVVCAGVVLQL